MRNVGGWIGFWKETELQLKVGSKLSGPFLGDCPIPLEFPHLWTFVLAVIGRNILLETILF